MAASYVAGTMKDDGINIIYLYDTWEKMAAHK